MSSSGLCHHWLAQWKSIAIVTFSGSTAAAFSSAVVNPVPAPLMHTGGLPMCQLSIYFILEKWMVGENCVGMALCAGLLLHTGPHSSLCCPADIGSLTWHNIDTTQTKSHRVLLCCTSKFSSHRQPVACRVCRGSWPEVHEKMCASWMWPLVFAFLSFISLKQIKLLQVTTSELCLLL